MIVRLRLLRFAPVYAFAVDGDRRELVDPDGPPTARQLELLNRAGAIALVEPGQLEPLTASDASGAIEAVLALLPARELVRERVLREPRDLLGEIEALFRDGVWRTYPEICDRRLGGIGATRDEVRATLCAHPERFFRLGSGEEVGRSRQARPIGTRAMLAALDEGSRT